MMTTERSVAGGADSGVPGLRFEHLDGPDVDAVPAWYDYFSDPHHETQAAVATAYLPAITDSVTRRYRKKTAYSAQHDIDDFVSLGWMELYKMVPKWDYQQGPFWRLANIRIAGEFYDEMRRHDFLSRSAREKAKEDGTGRVEISDEAIHETLFVASPQDEADEMADRVARSEFFWHEARSVLTSDQADILMLRVRNEWTNFDVAALYGKSHAWVSQQVSDAIFVLSALLGADAARMEDMFGQHATTREGQS